MGCTSSELLHSSQPATGTPLELQESPKGSRQGPVPAHTAGCSQGFPALHQSKPQTTSATPRGLDCLRPRHSKPPRAISRGKQDLLALPASTTTLSYFHPPSSVDSNLTSSCLQSVLQHSLQDCACSFILCHCCSTPVLLLQILNLSVFFHFQHF